MPLIGLCGQALEPAADQPRSGQTSAQQCQTGRLGHREPVSVKAALNDPWAHHALGCACLFTRWRPWRWRWR
jgi:hypothetical protein